MRLNTGQKRETLKARYGLGAVVDYLSGAVLPDYNKVIYVNGWASASGDGSTFDGAYKTMAEAMLVVEDNDLILLYGKITEQVTAPVNVFDVTIRGTVNRPRNCTADGVQQGVSADWRPFAAGTATPNLTLREQGWTVENIIFSSPNASSCIKLSRGEEAANMDASHATIRNCRFVGANTTTSIGIDMNGGSFNCLIEGNVFQSLGTAMHSGGVGIDIHTNNQIIDNDFMGNANDILCALKNSTIQNNRFHTVSTLYLELDHAGSSPSGNVVVFNFVADTASNFKGKASGGATDMVITYCSDALAFGYS